jgi:2-polyprenyl-3-methyl-5-hydroxy-6-metoxy-1,4-benzoquinol methylase
MIIKEITSDESKKENLDTWCYEVGSRFEEIGISAASDFYDKWLALNNNNFKQFESTFVIDLGSGDGSSSEELANLGFKVLAVDINKEKLNKIKNKNITKINLDMKQYLQLPFEVENIFTHHSLEHTIDAKEIIELCGKRLQKGGLYYAVVPANDYLHSVHHVVFEDPMELLPSDLTPLYTAYRERFNEKEYICLATKG